MSSFLFLSLVWGRGGGRNGIARDCCFGGGEGAVIAEKLCLQAEVEDPAQLTGVASLAWSSQPGTRRPPASVSPEELAKKYSLLDPLPPLPPPQDLQIQNLWSHGPGTGVLLR